MPTTIPIQTSFAGGELSPKLMGRVDTELWKKSLAHCLNFEPLALGPNLMRGGTRKAALYPGLNQGRLLDFPRQGDVGFLLLLAGGLLRVLEADGPVTPVVAGSLDQILNPRFQYGWQYWKRFSLSPTLAEAPQAGSVVDGRYLLTHGALPILWVPGIAQTTASLPAGTYTLKITYATARGNSLTVAAGTAVGLGDLLNVVAPDTGGLSKYQTATYAVVLAAPGPVSITVQARTIDAEVVAGGAYRAELREVGLRSPGGGPAEWASPWADAQLERVRAVSEPARDRIMFFHPRVEPQELLFDAVTGAWAFRAIVFTQPSAPAWNYGDFQGAYPGVAELYQGRLVVGGIPGKENTVLASASGEPYNFREPGLNEPDSNAAAFSLDVSTKGAWRWMHGQKTLLMGTDKGEHILTAQGGVVTPSDFEVRRQSGFGSASVPAIDLGELVLYVSRDRRRLRMLDFDLQKNGWQTRDLTFTSEHLTGGLVREVAWISTGNDKVVAIMQSGEVAAWTFHGGEKVTAPWRLDFGGFVHSMAVVDCGDQDRVWLLVQRAGGLAIEEWAVADTPDRILLDSWVSGSLLDMFGAFTGELTGLDHLEGQPVVPIVDGVVQAPKVVSGGAITLSSGTQAIAGLFTPRTFTTLRHEGGNPAGTTQGAKQRPVKLSLRLNDSALPLVNGERIGADRSPATPMDTVEARVTGDYAMRVLGWEDGAAVTITQDVPIRTEVLALYAIVATREAT